MYNSCRQLSSSPPHMPTLTAAIFVVLVLAGDLLLSPVIINYGEVDITSRFIKTRFNLVQTRTRSIIGFKLYPLDSGLNWSSSLTRPAKLTRSQSSRLSLQPIPS